MILIIGRGCTCIHIGGCNLIVKTRIIFATGCTNLKWMSLVNFYLYYIAGLFVFGAQHA